MRNVLRSLSLASAMPGNEPTIREILRSGLMEKDYVQRRNEQWECLFPHLNLEGILGRMLRIVRYYQLQSSKVVKEFGVTSGEFDVLGALLHSGPPHELPPKEITKMAYRTPGAITHLLDHLEQKQLICRCANAQSRRSILVCLTPAGIELATNLLIKHTQMENELLHDLPESDKEFLRDIFKRMLLNWERTKEFSPPDGENERTKPTIDANQDES
mgnify:CR=1 FL=1